MPDQPAPARCIIDASRAGATVSAVVRQLLPGCTWSRARSLCEQGRVRLDGSPCRDAAQRLDAGVELTIDPNAPRKDPRGLGRERIVFVDDDLVVVDKPAGMLSVPHERGDRTTLIDLTLTTLGGRGKRGAELGAVHRLDKETSGLMMFTRTLAAKRTMQEAFREHHLERGYVALVAGRARAMSHDTFLLEDRGDGRRGSHGRFRPARGRPPAYARRAITHVRVLESFERATLIACRLETGRQHQIRIHLSEAGTPVLGDRVYARRSAEPHVEAPRLMLHAAVLGFDHPRTGEPLRFERPVPEDFDTLLAALRSVRPRPG